MAEGEPTAAAEPPGAAAEGLTMARQALAAARSEARRRGRTTAPAGQAGRDTRSGTSFLRRGEEVRSGPSPDDRDPQLLAGAVPRLLAAQGWEGQAAASDALTNWARVVGEDLAAHCTPERLTKGTLVIVAESTSWATQVRLLAPMVLGKVNEHLRAIGGPAAEEVREIRVRGPEAPSWRKGSLAVKGRGPRDTYG